MHDLNRMCEVAMSEIDKIAEQNLEVIREKKLKVIEEQLSAVITNSREIGLSLDDLQHLLKILYEE